VWCAPVNSWCARGLVSSHDKAMRSCPRPHSYGQRGRVIEMASFEMKSVSDSGETGGEEDAEARKGQPILRRRNGCPLPSSISGEGERAGVAVVTDPHQYSYTITCPSSYLFNTCRPGSRCFPSPAPISRGQFAGYHLSRFSISLHIHHIRQRPSQPILHVISCISLRLSFRSGVPNGQSSGSVLNVGSCIGVACGH
jgi:hypothetical protein